MPPTQAVELQHKRLVFLRRGVASRGVWLLAGRIDAQPVIAEPRRDALLAHQTRRIAGIGKLQAHADPYGQSSLPPHPHERAHTGRPIRQVAGAGDAQRVSLLLPRRDHLVFFVRRGERHHLVDPTLPKTVSPALALASPSRSRPSTSAVDGAASAVLIANFSVTRR